MRNLHVRNVPDDVYEALRRAAEAEGRSLSSEVVAILKRGLAGEIVDRASILRHVEERRRKAGTMRLSAVDLVREDRDR